MRSVDEDTRLNKGFIEAREVTRNHAKNFYFASRFLPAEKKNASYAVYAICRLSDDSVDVASKDSFKQRLEEMKKNIESAYSKAELDNSLLCAFRQTIRTHKIPKEYFDLLLEGMEMDIEKNRYGSFEELYQYCYRAAGAVGLIMLKIFEYSDDQAEKHAIDLGVAMQLTNILRGIKEDYARGRIYLPQDEMSRFGISPNNLSQGKVDEQFSELLKLHIERARDYYRRSTKGIPMISNKRSRLVTALMKNIYAGILTAIEKNRYDVFSQRASVNIWRKIAITFKTLTKKETDEDNLG